MPARRRGRSKSTQFGRCKVILLAGGFGTRLAERTDELPKPMVHVGGRPILWHILKIYSHFDFNDFIVAAGYKSEIIKRFFLEYRENMSDVVFDFANDRIERLPGPIEPWRIAVIDTGPNTMTGGRIGRLQTMVGRSTFMLTYGDGVANINIKSLLRFHKSHKKLATFTAVRHPALYGVPTLKGDRVVQFAEKRASEGDWISGGFFVLEPGVFDYIQGDDTSFEFHVLPRLASDGQLMAFRHADFWHPMDTLRDVRLLNDLWQKGLAPWHLWK